MHKSTNMNATKKQQHSKVDKILIMIYIYEKLSSTHIIKNYC